MWIAIVALSLLISGILAIRFVVSHAEPIIRARVIQTLSIRFHSKVELSGLEVTIGPGVRVTGNGLKIFGTTDPNPYEPGFQPLINLAQFRFETSLRNLFRSPMHIDTVFVEGLELNLPPKGERKDVKALRSKTRVSIFVDKFLCRDTKLLINTSKPGKPPLEFDISELKLKDFGPGQAFRFEATLVNPKPVGDVHSKGQFGPWQPESPRDTPVKGDYSFTNADLSTIKGIAGILSSSGQYSGTLSNIEVQGSTDTPDFRIASSAHAVPLHTDFHAIVDGTSGDTYLRPVNANFLGTSLTARGSVVRVKSPHGHDVELDVTLERARIEDLLQLGVRTEPPIMTGPVEMTTRLSLPPGEKSVADRIGLSGTFRVPRTHFNNPKVQGKLDSLSLVSQGKPKEAHEHSGGDVPADLRGAFALNDGVLSFSLLHFLIPGTHVDLSGIYSLDGQTFDFHGKAMLDAKLSQMTTGWKSILLKPVDPFFRKDGAGTEIPIRVTGTQSEPHFGLDFGHKDRQDSRKKTDTVSQRR
jgi:hypothetical protein